MLMEETRQLPNHKTFGNDTLQSNNPNGIPPYYYQKPEVTSEANGGGPENSKRVKKDSGKAKTPKSKSKTDGIGKQGCVLCGKKAHRKGNDCPNNPNKAKE